MSDVVASLVPLIVPVISSAAAASFSNGGRKLATTLCDLRSDDQVLAFRILDRGSLRGVRIHAGRVPVALVKAMGQEDVAALLNHMSPDDRTLFLSELPADASSCWRSSRRKNATRR